MQGFDVAVAEGLGSVPFAAVVQSVPQAGCFSLVPPGRAEQNRQWISHQSSKQGLWEQLQENIDSVLPFVGVFELV